MDAPICVTDAVTLADHIHKIKAWVYNGHLRLVLPSSSKDYPNWLVLYLADGFQSI